MKLSDLDPKDIEVQPAPSSGGGLKLSSFDPKDIEPVENVPIGATIAAKASDYLPFVNEIGAAGKTGMDVLTGNTPISDAHDEFDNELINTYKDKQRIEDANPKTSIAMNVAPFAALGLAKAAPIAADIGGSVMNRIRQATQGSELAQKAAHGAVNLATAHVPYGTMINGPIKSGVDKLFFSAPRVASAVAEEANPMVNAFEQSQQKMAREALPSVDVGAKTEMASQPLEKAITENAGVDPFKIRANRDDMALTEPDMRAIREKIKAALEAKNAQAPSNPFVRDIFSGKP